MSFSCRGKWFDSTHWSWNSIFPRCSRLHTEIIREPGGAYNYVRACDGNYYMCVLKRTMPCSRVGELMSISRSEAFGEM